MQSLYRFSSIVLLTVSVLFAFSACKSDAPTDAVSSTPQNAANPDADKAVVRPLQSLLDEYLKPYPDELTAMSDREKSPEIFTAMEAYNAGRYAEAIELFPNSATTMEQAGYIKLYHAISQLMAGHDHDAFTSLQRMRSNMGKAFELSEWYLALNYVAFNNKYEARQKLEKIAAAGGYHAEQARELLEELPEQKK